MPRRVWTAERIATLRRLAGKEPYRVIAARLGLTEPAVRSAAKKFGATTRTFWTAEEDAALVRLRAEGRTGPQIARALGRSQTAVYQHLADLDLPRRPRLAWTDAALARLRRRNAEGATDTAIAAELGCERHTVSARRKALGLPSNELLAKRDNPRKQVEAMGIPNLASLRKAAWMARAAELGWPTTINGRCANLRHVQILDALWHHGPQTQRELAERIGMSWKGSSRSMASNGPGHTYLAELIHAGLVVSLGRCVKGQGKGRSVNLYSLSLTTERTPDEP